jgi:hypothetical protein
VVNKCGHQSKPLLQSQTHTPLVTILHLSLHLIYVRGFCSVSRQFQPHQTLYVEDNTSVRMYSQNPNCSDSKSFYWAEFLLHRRKLIARRGKWDTIMYYVTNVCVYETIDGVWIGESIYWPHDLEIQVITAHPLTSTIHKIPQRPLRFSSLLCFHQPFPGNGS